MSSNTSKTGLNLKTKPSLRKGKIHPVSSHEPFQEPALSEDKAILGIKLLSAVRDGKVKNAIDLIKRDADTTKADGVGWTALHHSASQGFVDLIVQLMEHGATIDAVDNSEETPLHKASRKGHTESIIALIAFGATLKTENRNGQNPLELAIKAEQVQAVETLCMLGADVMLQDWSWTMGEMNSEQKKIVDILLHQHSREAAYSYGFVISETVYIKATGVISLKGLEVDIIDDEPADDNYFLFMGKMKAEYCEAMENLKNQNDIISDIFEMRMWGKTRKSLKLKLRIDTMLKKNESLVLVSPDGNIGHVENVEIFEETTDNSNHYAVATLIISTKKIPVIFCMGVEVKPEKFTINTKEDVTVTPQAEPDAEINIPKGSFDSDGELSLQVMDTKEVNEEENAGDILMTNVIDISMSDGQQPKQEIGLKIPIHHKMDEGDEMVILATSKESPNGIEDWKILEAEMDASGKAATFKIKHFSIYAGSSKEKIKTDLIGVVSALERSVNRQKKIEFFLLTKWVNADNLLVIVEGTTPRKMDTRIQNWVKLGYNEQSLKKSNECNAKNGQRFIFTFSGNLQEVSSEESFALIFQSNRDNFRIFSMCLEDADRPYSGVVDVSMETTVERSILVKKPGFFPCCGGRKFVEKEKCNEETIVGVMNYEIFKPPPARKDTKTTIEPENQVSHQTLNKLGLFKYKVKSTSRLRSSGYEM